MSAPTKLPLSCLNGVRPSGTAWRADCPAGHRSRGALVISKSEAGGVLLHGHAGCPANAVLAAVGIQPSELYPPRLPREALSPLQRAERAYCAKHTTLLVILDVLVRTATIVQAAAMLMHHGEPMCDEDKSLLAQAVKNLESNRLALHQARRR